MTVYGDLVQKLGTKAEKHFKYIFRLLNRGHYDRINLDEEALEIIENIKKERERIAASMETKLSNLEWLNERLLQFGKEPQPTKTKAKKLLKKIFINIYDLEEENYNRTTKKMLLKELRSCPEKRFPLHIAKKHTNLKCFLVSI